MNKGRHNFNNDFIHIIREKKLKNVDSNLTPPLQHIDIQAVKDNHNAMRDRTPARRASD